MLLPRFYMLFVCSVLTFYTNHKTLCQAIRLSYPVACSGFKIYFIWSYKRRVLLTTSRLVRNHRLCRSPNQWSIRLSYRLIALAFERLYPIKLYFTKIAPVIKCYVIYICFTLVITFIFTLTTTKTITSLFSEQFYIETVK